MKKKLALLMAAIMTVAMVPVTAFASTKLTAVDEITTAVDKKFTSRVELVKSNDQVDVEGTREEDEQDVFDVYVTLTNGKFATNDNDDYLMDSVGTDAVTSYNYWDADTFGIHDVDVISDTKAKVTVGAYPFNNNNDWSCVLPIIATATDTGDVVATFTSNVTAFKTASEVIATAVDGDVEVATDGVKTFVVDADDTLKIKDITINELTATALTGEDITLKLKGNWKYDTTHTPTVSFLNETVATTISKFDSDEIVIDFTNFDSNTNTDADFTDNMLTKMTISGIYLTTTSKCDTGDVATITVSSKDFSSVKLEVAKMVDEAVTYSVEDDDLPTIWAGKNYADDETNTLEVSIEENTGDILNTSRKATFTFPEGIEVCGIEYDGVVEDTESDYNFEYQIDENVVSIWNYSKDGEESDKTDMSIKFILNAAPTFSGDVDVTLGGQFDDTSFTVATVKAPYTVEAKTSEVLIDYRYVPVNEIVITEAEDGILDDGDQIVLAVEKMDFEDAGDVEVTEGDIDVDVDVDDAGDDYLYDYKDAAYLAITVNDASTEASTIVVSGLELYLDRTLPVGGYALQNVGGFNADGANNILWENSSNMSVSAVDKAYTNDDYTDAEIADAEFALGYDYTPAKNEVSNGLFKYKTDTVNDEYVNVITAARDSDDSMTTKKIVITVGATTMAAGTETVTLDAPAYINAENYTMLPLRAISEAFGATVNWDNATKTVTILSGQRIISMTIGSRTMYINGTPVAMNTAPEITADRTFVPVRDLANSLGISNINWTEASGTVTLN